MLAFRKCAVVLSVALIGFAGTANAGFTGDVITVSLTVHTTGAADRVAFNNEFSDVWDPGTAWGYSRPNGVSDYLIWDFHRDADTFTLSVRNQGPVTTTVDPLALSIINIDEPFPGVLIIGENTFGFVPEHISFTANSISINAPEGSLAILPGGAILRTTFLVVPEASTFIMMSLVASGLAGGYIARRRKVQG